MQVASLSETLTVTGESPLVDISVVAGRRQRRSPPDGRAAAAGPQLDGAVDAWSRASPPTTSTNTPGVRDDMFQLNLDGQQITQKIAGSGFGQPKFSREAIAEFQIVTNLFDITQGRSTGIQVQAISRSGTNNIRRQRLRLLPRRQVERDGPGRQPRAAVSEPADRRRDRRPDRPGQAALLRVVRVRARAGHRSSQRRRRCPGQTLHRAVQERRRRASSAASTGQLSTERPLHGPRLALGLGTTRSRSPPPTIRRTPRPDQARRPTSSARGPACSSSNKVQEVQGRLHPLRLDEPLRCRRWQDTADYDFPGLTIGSAVNYPQEFCQNTCEAPLRPDLEHGHARHQVRRRVHARAATPATGTSSRAGEYIFTSLPADISRRCPGRARRYDPSQWDLTGLDADRAALRSELSTATGPSTSRVRPGRSGSATPGASSESASPSTTACAGTRTGARRRRRDVTRDAIPIDNGVPSDIDIALEPATSATSDDIRDLGNVAPRGGFTCNVGGNGTTS